MTVCRCTLKLHFIFSFGYDVSRRIVDIRPEYGFDETCA